MCLSPAARHVCSLLTPPFLLSPLSPALSAAAAAAPRPPLYRRIGRAARAAASRSDEHTAAARMHYKASTRVRGPCTASARARRVGCSNAPCCSRIRAYVARPRRRLCAPISSASSVCCLAAQQVLHPGRNVVRRHVARPRPCLSAPIPSASSPRHAMAGAGGASVAASSPALHPIPSGLAGALGGPRAKSAPSAPRPLAPPSHGASRRRVTGWRPSITLLPPTRCLASPTIIQHCLI
jgi:hypothetical protein